MAINDDILKFLSSGDGNSRQVDAVVRHMIGIRYGDKETKDAISSLRSRNIISYNNATRTLSLTDAGLNDANWANDLGNINYAPDTQNTNNSGENGLLFITIIVASILSFIFFSGNTNNPSSQYALLATSANVTVFEYPKTFSTPHGFLILNSQDISDEYDRSYEDNVTVSGYIKKNNYKFYITEYSLTHSDKKWIYILP